MPKEQAPISRFVATQWHRLEERLVSGRYDINVSDTARERIVELQRFLVQPEERSCSVILYFNHQAYNDPLLAWRTATYIDPERKLQFFAPSSAWSSRLRLQNAKYLGIIMASKLAGISTVPVVQAHQVNSPEYGFTETDARESYGQLIRTARKLREEGPVLCLISPEGHRSESGILQDDVYAGILKIGRTISPTVYVPLAITFPEGYERDSLNFGKRVELDIGRWTCQDSRFDEPTIGQLMNNLADALPSELRGSWGSPTGQPEHTE